MALTVALQAQTAVDGPAPKVVLIELFTSEGCSSCPPADALLRQVNGSRTAGDQLVVGISEHVTYWNGLGWSDPFSSPAYTERQNAYSERFHLEGVYTPQMVINGAEQIVGSDRAALLRAVLAEEGQHPRVSVRILSSQVVGNSMTVSFSEPERCRRKGPILWRFSPTTPIAPTCCTAKTPGRHWHTSRSRDPSPVWPGCGPRGSGQCMSKFQPRLRQRKNII